MAGWHPAIWRNIQCICSEKTFHHAKKTIHSERKLSALGPWEYTLARTENLGLSVLSPEFEMWILGCVACPSTMKDLEIHERIKKDHHTYRARIFSWSGPKSGFREWDIDIYHPNCCRICAHFADWCPNDFSIPNSNHFTTFVTRNEVELVGALELGSAYSVPWDFWVEGFQM